MSYVVLARKYRPQSFEDLVGQEHVAGTLKNAIASGRVAHAMCFSGPRGTGKTTVARIFAKAMNCAGGPAPTPCNRCPSCLSITAGNSVDVFEIDGASNNSVDEVRELRENVKYAPAASAHKIYIIDEVHMLSPGAFNALLKTLEEPPSHVLFVLATTEVHKIPVTILSRCQRHDFRRIALPAVVAHLADLSRREAFPVPEDALWIIARESGGCMRDALSLLDQVIAFSEGGASLSTVLDILGVVDTGSLFTLSAALLSGDAARCLCAVDEFHMRGQDMKKLAADLVEHFRNLVAARDARDPEAVVPASGNEVRLYVEQAKAADAALLTRLFYGLYREEALVRQAFSPRTALEAALVRLCEAAPVAPLGRILEKLDWLKSLCESEPDKAVVYAGEPDPLPLLARVSAPVPEATQAPLSPAPPAPARPAEAPPPAAHAPEPGPAPAEGPAPDLKLTWRRVLEQIGRGSLFTYLSDCRLVSAGPEGVVIEAGGKALQERFLADKDYRQAVSEAFSRVLGHRADVTFVKAREAAQNGPAPEPAATDAEAAALRDHPAVQDALSVFSGARVFVEPLKR